jgi:Niemann-Pick C1 protein
VTQLTLTVDPIKLWAAPTSRARIERDFFEQTFRPFYRYFSKIVGTTVVFELKSI